MKQNTMLFKSFQKIFFKIKNILMPNPSYEDSKKTKHTLPSGFSKFLAYSVKQLKGCWRATNHAVLWLLPTPPLKTSKSLWKEQSTWPSPVNHPNARLHREETDGQFMEREKTQQKHLSIRCSKSQYINDDDSKKNKMKKIVPPKYYFFCFFPPLNFKSYRRTGNHWEVSGTETRFYQCPETNFM